MDRDLIAEILIAVIEDVVPLDKSLMGLLIAAYEAAFPRGVCCSYGKDGLHNGETICVPARWTARDWEDRTRTCAHCPIFKRAVSAK